VGEIPRLLDMGQCNNAYGAIRVAVALAQAVKCGVNDLPLTIVLSWFEQKAVAVLLTLLSLGVKGIRIGPKPPAFVSPAVFEYLQKNFDLKLTGDAPLSDLQEALRKAA
jgi:hydroxylamine reductase